MSGSVHLDTGSEPWVGVFPGLGRVHIHADGSYSVQIEPGGHPSARQALTDGWAEPLSWHRVGLRVARATTVVDDRGRALMLTGPVDPVTSVVAGLIGEGWLLLADTLTPVRQHASLVALPRRSPWLVPSDPVGSVADGERPRPGSTAQIRTAPRVSTPASVRGLVAVSSAVPTTSEATLTEQHGHDRLRRTAGVLLPVIGGPPPTPVARMRDDLLDAAISVAVLHSPVSQAWCPSDLLSWWRETTT